jgi:protoporphyrinogen oxidase
VVVLGGGLAGIGAAHALAQAGFREITVVESTDTLGGLAGTFRIGEHFYPLAYHHILDRDRTLLYFLDRIGALDAVRWRRIRMLFRVGARLYDLSSPLDFLRFPMGLPDKVRFALLMLRAFRKADWREWEGRSARELLDAWAGSGVRRAMFEPLTRIKFQLSCDEVSAAWLGKRLYFREGSAPLGYIPGQNWTKVLCDGLTRLLEEDGVRIRVRAPVVRLHGSGEGIAEVELGGGDRLPAEVVVSTVPTVVYRRLVPEETTPALEAVRYTAVVSAICATRQPIDTDFYWMNLISLDCSASGLFRLESLNPSIGAPGEACLNFVTHVPSCDDAFFARSEAELLRGYLEDFRRIFGFALEPFWTRVNKLALYTPVFVRGYENPPVRSTRWRNVYFAGNYRTFPSIASTGTALGSGLEAADAVLADRGRASGLSSEVAGFRLPVMPRG